MATPAKIESGALSRFTSGIDSVPVPMGGTGLVTVPPNTLLGCLALDVLSAFALPLAPQYLGSGIRDGSKFLRDDGTWVAPTVFGQNYQNVDSITESTTTLAIFQDKINFITPSIPSGTYRFDYSYMWQTPTNTTCEYQVVIDGVVRSGVRAYRVTHTSVYGGDAGYFDLVLTAGTHTVSLQWRAQAAGNTAKIKEARISLFRVA